jgi:hypothetical protein
MRKNYLLIYVTLISIGAKSQSDSTVLSSFYQGSANNCASIALIKAAMYKYGYNQIFTYKREGNDYKVVLRDGAKLTISEDQLNMAVKYSNFDTTDTYKILGGFKDSVLFYAYLSYSCIAKNISENGYWSCSDENGKSSHIKKVRDYEKALIFITKTSYCTDNCYRLLGLKIKENRIFDYDGNTILNDKGVILYSWGHAVAVYNNQLDCHGDWLPISSSKVCYNHFKWYIVLQ